MIVFTRAIEALLTATRLTVVATLSYELNAGSVPMQGRDTHVNCLPPFCMRISTRQSNNFSIVIQALFVKKMSIFFFVKPI